jgi:hypothetical protein
MPICGVGNFNGVRLREAFIAVDADMNRFDAICTKLNSAFDREKFEEFIGMWSRK